MVRSKKFLEIIEEENLIKNANDVGEYLLGELMKLSIKYPIISNVRGKGLMCAFDLPDQISCDKLKKLSFDNNLIIISCGVKSIRLRPVLDVTRSDVDKLINILNNILPMI